MLRRVSESGARDLQLRWRYFSLTQVNNQQEGWTVWGASADDPGAKGRLAFHAAEASRLQGRFDNFHAALLEARHAEGLDLDDRAVIEEVAGLAGLDLDRFRGDLADGSLIQALARDHREAVDQLGVFGTPTFHLPGRGAAYVRVRPAPEGEAALRVFDQVVSITAEEPYFLELKRSRRRPQEPGAVSLPAAEAPVARSSGSRPRGS
ncbi:DsbA family protein [Candidatus Nephthysia bennettiae]|uniref:DsbA family oxidoreductase n=1 Tax=Candidatus Nephthysia bennettiae TaxID=3127016 RepID=UPI0030C6E591